MPDGPVEQPTTQEVEARLLEFSTLTREQLHTAALDVLAVLVDLHRNGFAFCATNDGKSFQQVAVKIPGLTDVDLT